jgi:carbonic anhydrase
MAAARVLTPRTRSWMAIANLLEQNRIWAERMRASDARFFDRLSGQQAPQYLWIGCSDSRVPANEIVDLPPGEIFVHRNIGNVVVHTDLNCLSVIQFSVDMLRVRDIIVVGHYGCSGVNAALRRHRVGLSDNWLRHIQDVHQAHATRFDGIDDAAQQALLCELNVVEQVMHVCQTTAVTDAWQRGQELAVHGCVYGLHDGLLRDLGLSVAGEGALREGYAQAVASITQRYGVGAGPDQGPTP